jgi:hypothetical protein
LQFIPLCPPRVHPERSIGRPLRTVQSRAVGRAGFAGCVRCPISRRRGAGGLGG